MKDDAGNGRQVSDAISMLLATTTVLTTARY